MELKKLEYLESVYRLQSFTKASQEHFISQPSLSNAIRSLETELNCTLINRNTKPISFTPEGERFIWHVKKILGDIKQAKEDMTVFNSNKEHLIRLAWPSCFINDYLQPKLYTDFHDLFPNYQIYSIESTINNTMQMLLNDDLDLAYVHIPDSYDTNQFEFIPIICCEMYVLISQDHPLASCQSISFPMLEKETIFSFQKGSLYRKKLEEKFSFYNLHPHILSINKMSIIRQLVAENRGISFVTIDSIEHLRFSDKITLIPLSDPITFVKGFLIKNSRASDPAIHNIISFIKSVIQKMSL